MTTLSHGVEIVYEDNHILVANKPSNIPSQEDSSGDMDMLRIIKAYLKEKYNKPGNVYLGLVHRLDRPTGGLMLFAKTSKAASRLSEAIRKGGIERYYICHCNPAPKADHGEMIDYLLKGEDNTSRVVKKENKDGKRASLSYTVTQRLEDGSGICEVQLETGRSHQIRVQFASRHMPIVGDARYGSGGTQLALWAFRLAFVHPVQKKWMEFLSKPPQTLIPLEDI